MRVWRGGLAMAVAIAALGMVWPGTAWAQDIGQYFQSNVPGFDQERGVSVLERPRLGTEAPPLRIGGFTIRAGLDEVFGYDTNPLARSGGPGSWVIQTEPSLALNTAGPRGTFGAALALDATQYLEVPQQNVNNWTASLGGTYLLGHDVLTLGYAHVQGSETSQQLGSIASTAATSFQTDDVRASYGFRLGRLLLTPALEYSATNYGGGTNLPGLLAGQTLLNYNVLTVGVTAHYPLANNRSIVLVVQGTDTSYAQPPVGQPDSSSQGVILLGGLDYQKSGLWHYRLLAGVERRSFTASIFPTVVAPIVEANVTWTPNEPTTVTATASRRVEPSATVGIGSFTYTDLGLVIDHELRHSLIVQGRAAYEIAQYAAGGSQDQLTLGAGLTWVLNRRLQVTADYDYRWQGPVRGTLSPISDLATTVSGQYEDNSFVVRFHVAL